MPCSSSETGGFTSYFVARSARTIVFFGAAIFFFGAASAVQRRAGGPSGWRNTAVGPGPPAAGLGGCCLRLGFKVHF